MFKILNLKMINRGDLIASFDVEIEKWGGFILCECTFFENNEKSWINLPNRSYDDNGEKKYKKIAKFANPALEKKFKEKIKEELMKEPCFNK